MNNTAKILDSVAVMDWLRDYAAPHARLTYMLKTGKLIRLRRGVYLLPNHSNIPRKAIANRLYGPSYVSFETALAEYGLIPERVKHITSATFAKNKNKAFQTPVGYFIYKRIHPAVYPYGIIQQEINGMPVLIASREKALCDTLSQIRGARSLKKFSSLIQQDLRLDMDQFSDLDFDEIQFLAERYPQQNVRLFRDWFKREYTHA
jgi:predicted transcriptional regulator of viral defense system